MFFVSIGPGHKPNRCRAIGYYVGQANEVLDKNNAEYEKADASTIAAEIAVYGNLSRFSISVKEQEGETELRVTMARPCEGLSEEGIRRAITAVTDSIAQHLENELVISKIYRCPEAETE